MKLIKTAFCIVALAVPTFTTISVEETKVVPAQFKNFEQLPTELQEMILIKEFEDLATVEQLRQKTAKLRLVSKSFKELLDSDVFKKYLKQLAKKIGQTKLNTLYTYLLSNDAKTVYGIKGKDKPTIEKIANVVENYLIKMLEEKELLQLKKLLLEYHNQNLTDDEKEYVVFLITAIANSIMLYPE